MREYLDEFRLRISPVLEDPSSTRAARVVAMALQQGAYFGNVLVADKRLDIDAGFVAAARREVALIVENEGAPPAHAGGEVAAGGTEYDDGAIGHVFAAVVTDAFNYGDRAGVANGEPLAGDAIEKNFAAGCAVEDDVADKNAFFGEEEGRLGRVGDDASAGETLAEIIVAVAFELKGDAGGNECTEALTGRAFELEVNRVIGNPAEP